MGGMGGAQPLASDQWREHFSGVDVDER